MLRVTDRDEEEVTRESLRQRLLVNKLLHDTGATTVTLEYDGYGDSGGPGDCTVKDQNVIDFLWQYVEEHHSEFWNNEGGRGEITWDLRTDIITIDHNDVVEDTENTTTIIQPDGSWAHEETSAEDLAKIAVVSCAPLHTYLVSLANKLDDVDAALAAEVRKLF